jgi:hypothetical protein
MRTLFSRQALRQVCATASKISDLNLALVHWSSSVAVLARSQKIAAIEIWKDDAMSQITRLPYWSVALVFGWACASAQQGSDVRFAGPEPKPSPLVSWPKATGNVSVEQTVEVAGSFDGGMQRYHGAGDLGTSSQDESQAPVFKLSDGAVLSNVIIGHPAADGIHCKGSCTLRNVWWENVGEDAATFRGQSPTDVMLIDGGGASGASDKVFQDNGHGTMHIKDFYFEWFGKVFRSCGNCSKQMDRHVILENVTAVAGANTATIVGLNLNYGDTAEFRGKNVIYDLKGGVPICLMYQANDTGGEPKSIGPAPDGGNCKNLNANVTIRTELEGDLPEVAEVAVPSVQGSAATPTVSTGH